MKDRTPKFPGRVKLKPVSGQTDTYDMTRADDPDDTGTPFNKRTMLQDSTAQFLKLPLANPFPDDALRHMVDRIVPIGTIRTSPAQSLGDAWLKCDGSAVTYGNYPQLCQVLRNSTEAVTWNSNTFPTSYNINKASNPVYFDGRWIVAVADESTYIRILSAQTLDGEWTVEKTITADTTYTTQSEDVYSRAGALRITADQNYCVVAYRYKISANKLGIGAATIEKESDEWTTILFPESEFIDIKYLLGVGNWNGRFAIAGSGKWPSGASSLEAKDVQIFYTNTPTSNEGWEQKGLNITFGNKNTATACGAFACVNGKWIIEAAGELGGSGTVNVRMHVFACDDSSLFSFESVAYIDLGFYITGNERVSEPVYMGGRYYFATVGYRADVTGLATTLYSSLDLASWDAGTEIDIGDTSSACNAIANESMLVIANSRKVLTSTMPDAGFVQAVTPNASVHGLGVRGNTVVASTVTGILYYDYTYVSKLLPNISLSSDTTTFIKAKNELDVFEAGGD